MLIPHREDQSSAAEFSSTQNLLNFLVKIKTLIGQFMCVCLEIDLNLEEGRYLGPERGVFWLYTPSCSSILYSIRRWRWYYKDATKKIHSDLCGWTQSLRPNVHTIHAKLYVIIVIFNLLFRADSVILVIFNSIQGRQGDILIIFDTIQGIVYTLGRRDTEVESTKETGFAVKVIYGRQNVRKVVVIII